MVPCRGFSGVGLPLPSLWPGLRLQGAGVFLFDPCLAFQAVCLLGAGDLLRSYMKSHLILSPSFNGNLVW